MEPILKSEIFFFITSIFVILFTFAFLIFSFYLIKTMKNFSDMSARLNKIVNETSDEVGDLRERVLESPIFNFIFGKKKRNKK